MSTVVMPTTMSAFPSKQSQIPVKERPSNTQPLVANTDELFSERSELRRIADLRKEAKKNPAQALGIYEDMATQYEKLGYAGFAKDARRLAENIRKPAKDDAPSPVSLGRRLGYIG